MVFESTLKISKEDADRLQWLLDQSEVDFEKEGLDIDSTVSTFTAVFDDGVEADIKVCSGETNLFIDPVLFDKFGSELCVNDTCDELLGYYSFDVDDNEYIVHLILE